MGYISAFDAPAVAGGVFFSDLARIDALRKRRGKG